MTNPKFASGAFCFTRACGLQPRLPEDLQSLAAKYGIPTEFIPAYAGDRVAISQVSSGRHRRTDH